MPTGHTGSRTLTRCRFIAAVVLITAMSSASGFAQSRERPEALSQQAAQSAAAKLSQVETATSGHGFDAVRITEAEANSYLYYDLQPSVPDGVSNLHLQFQPGRPHGSAVVDFDKIKQSMKTPPNALIAYFLTGIHRIGVSGTFYATNGLAQFHLETVTLDDITMPEMLVDYLIDHYLRTRYPGLAIDRPFPLSPGVDKVTVESGDVLITGKQ